MTDAPRLTNTQRVHRARVKARTLKQSTEAGFTIVPADVLVRRPDGTVFAWTHEAGWRRVQDTPTHA